MPEAAQAGAGISLAGHSMLPTHRLAHDYGRNCDLRASSWCYRDAAGKRHGPFSFQRMLKWAASSAFGDEAMRVQHADLRVWLPLWFLPQADAQINRLPLPGEVQCGGIGWANVWGGMRVCPPLMLWACHRGNPCCLCPAGRPWPDEEDGEQAMDWEAVVAEVKNARAAGLLGLAGDTGAAAATAASQGPMPDWPELTGLDGAPVPMDMDEELSAAAAGGGDGGARVFVIADTNVLLSHLTLVERVFGRLASAAADAAAAGTPALEAQLVVPWVVLNELDRLKGSGSRPEAAAAARRALHRLRVLTVERDAWVRGQPAAEHRRAVADVALPGAGGSPELQNDDMILQARAPASESWIPAGSRAAACMH